MGIDDKLSNAAQNAKGSMKESAGKATDDDDLEREGRNDQGKAKIKEAGEKMKDAVRDAKDAFRR